MKIKITLKSYNKFIDCKKASETRLEKVAKPLSMGYHENRKIFGEKEQTSVTAQNYKVIFA